MVHRIIRYFCISFLIFLMSLPAKAQQPGDTIVVNALDYWSRSRDTMVAFPDNGLTYEKIILKYGMRCKNGLVSTGNNRNLGCGEWDYSCNTYVVDSAKVEELASQHPSHLISGFSGDTFSYTTRPTYDFYRFQQDQLTVSTQSEEIYPLGSGGESFDAGFSDASFSGRFYFRYSAQELRNSGFTAGEIDGIVVDVLNEGADVRFLKVDVAHFNGTVPDPQTNAGLSYENHFNQHASLMQGENKLIFKTPFIWDGTSDVMFQFSYSSTGGQDGIQLNGFNGVSGDCFFTNDNYSVDLGQQGRFDIDGKHLQSIEGEMTVSMWVYGNRDFLPANTTILWGYENNPNDRDLNIHLPWGNGQMYFDCGFDNGFDRINKQATAFEIAGQWNFWTFTKNAGSGEMKIYLNGQAWHSGIGLSRTIAMDHVVLGMDAAMRNNFKGDVAELRIWDVVLSDEQIADWRYRHVGPEHPEYDHLVAYYDFHEGSGTEITDSKTGSVSSGENIYWKGVRGDRLFRNFKHSDIKPLISLLTGEYTRSVQVVYEMDSVQRTPNVVREYEVVANPGSRIDDEIVVKNTYIYYEARAEQVFDGETGDLIREQPVDVEGTIHVVPLDHIRRFPFYIEIMSFVTPYGIGVDFGPDGVAWYFDMTDFAPVLKGNKRMLMTLGGQYQEEMDLDFLFIVGTPPRDVLEFNQLWQGTPRLGSASIASIRNDSKFPPLQVPLRADGQHFKLRSTITGHGSEGEFHQNGGIIYHMINLDGEFEELVWSVTQECSENPVYPQGGTWVYDRQGWCPGERSLLMEQDLGIFVEAGKTVEIDYNTTEAQVAAGDYRYIVSHQLVTYGPPNHERDAAIVEIRKPNDNILFNRLNPACDRPEIMLQNTGGEPLESAKIHYWVNDRSRVLTYEWDGYLEFMETERVQLPVNGLFEGLSSSGTHRLFAEVDLGGDQYSHNNRMSSQFGVVDMFENGVILEVRTNSRHFENRYTVTNELGETILANNLQFANRTFRDTLRGDGCYVFRINDTGDDGLSWWANPNQGTGSMLIKDLSGRTLRVLQTDFGGELTYSFGIGMITNVQEPVWSGDIRVFPNPAGDQCTVDGLQGDEEILLMDMMGQVLNVNRVINGTMAEFDLSGFVSGVYFLKLRRGKQFTTRKITIVR